MAQLSVQHGMLKQERPRTRTHPGPPPRFLGGFYCHLDTISEDVNTCRRIGVY